MESQTFNPMISSNHIINIPHKSPNPGQIISIPTPKYY